MILTKKMIREIGKQPDCFICNKTISHGDNVYCDDVTYYHSSCYKRNIQ